jgi:hypothetical protein
MRITDNELDAIENGAEALENLSHLLERIVAENSDATVGELREIGIAWELLFAAGKELRTMRQQKQFYEPANN